MNKLSKLGTGRQQRSGSLVAGASIAGNQIDQQVLAEQLSQPLETAKHWETVEIHTALCGIIVQQTGYGLTSTDNRVCLAHQFRVIGTE